MKLPLIACYDHDIILFDSTFSAENYIECADIINGSVIIFDSQGNEILPKIDRKKIFLNDAMIIIQPEECLRSKITLYLNLLKYEASNCNNVSLSDLLELLKIHANHF